MPTEAARPENQRTLVVLAILVLAVICLLCLCAAAVASVIYFYPRLSGGQGTGFQPASTGTVSSSTPPVSSPGSTGSGNAPGYAQAAAFAGKWDGTWNNTTYATTGDIHAVIAVQPDGTASIQLRISGNVFGVGSFPTVTYPGRYDAGGFSFRANGDPFFGDLQITIRYSGEVSMTGSALTLPGFLKVNASGSMANGTAELNYTVSFSNGTLAKGKASLAQTR